MGGGTMPNLAVVQSAGYAYRLRATMLKQEISRNGSLIRYSRGDIKVLDGPGLEGAACACYAFDRETYANIMH
jgi:hypothetical protein